MHLSFLILFVSLTSFAAVEKSAIISFKEIANELQKQRIEGNKNLKNNSTQKYLLRKKTNTQLRQSSTPMSSNFMAIDNKPSFDIPVTYNRDVRTWIKYYQTNGKSWLKERIERSGKYLPIMKKALADKGLPQDLAYIAMIESGFSAHAVSTADAVGYWQFIAPTAKRYNLRIDWWIDERRDFLKSTHAAASYLGDLYKQFNSWYLTASAYNMGEGRLHRLIKRHETNDYWTLSSKSDFPDETKDYIPKLLAALMISKSPKIYGFKNLNPLAPYEYDYIYVPGGTDLHHLSSNIGVTKERLEKLNPDLKMGFVPGFINTHKIRIPKGFLVKVSSYIRAQM